MNHPSFLLAYGEVHTLGGVKSTHFISRFVQILSFSFKNPAAYKQFSATKL